MNAKRPTVPSGRTFYFDVGSPYAYLAAELPAGRAAARADDAGGRRRRPVQVDRGMQLVGARRLPPPADGDGGDRTPRADLSPAPMRGPTRGRATTCWPCACATFPPSGHARGARSPGRGFATHSAAGRRPEHSGAAPSRRRPRRGSTGRRGGARLREPASSEALTTTTAAASGRGVPVPTSPSATSRPSAMTGSRTRPTTSTARWRRDGGRFDARLRVRCRSSPGAGDRGRTVDSGVRGRSVRGARWVPGRGGQGRRTLCVRTSMPCAPRTEHALQRQRVHSLAGADPADAVQGYLARLGPEAEQQGVALGEPRYDDTTGRASSS